MKVDLFDFALPPDRIALAHGEGVPLVRGNRYLGDTRPGEQFRLAQKKSVVARRDVTRHCRFARAVAKAQAELLRPARGDHPAQGQPDNNETGNCDGAPGSDGAKN